MSPLSKALLAVLASLPVSGAAQPDAPHLTPGDLPGLEIRSTANYAGDALYGYVNGGADLYHEYGFEQLSVQEVRLNGETWYCEVYRMTDPAGAFGIFSVSHGTCTPSDDLPRASCVSPRVIQWAQDRYFVRAACESGSPEAQATGLLLARTLSAKIPDGAWQIPPIPAAAGGTERTVILVRGILGMQNGFDTWSPFVEGLGDFEAVIVSREDSTGEIAAGELRFTADADLDRFSRAFSGTGKAVRSIRKSGRRILVLEADSPADSLWSRLAEIP
jgi:hypothetical protein